MPILHNGKELIGPINIHVNNKNNPHDVTCTQIGASPIPTISTDIGQWLCINKSTGQVFNVPSGGTWAYFIGFSNFGAYAGITSGGSELGGISGFSCYGFVWRIA